MKGFLLDDNPRTHVIALIMRLGEIGFQEDGIAGVRRVGYPWSAVNSLKWGQAMLNSELDKRGDVGDV